MEETNEPFTRDPGFSLNAFARRSFGVFQEEPFDVIWRFKPEAAADAREWLFHPDQVMEDQPDGSLIVRFRAGGELEMSWHLYTWGDAVEVIKPIDFHKLK
jgi:predicted DNA-binding transcriptional regulator YafY